jgi:electron transport complex protein RnfE
MSALKALTNGLREIPPLRLVLGLCPALAVTALAQNGLGMGLSATAVLVGSNMVISILRNVIPDKIRIPCFIVIIATFVSIVDMMLNAFLPALHAQLGIFVPLIVVNCIILGRAEAFASKNGVLSSVADGIGVGLSFTFALTVLGSIRELLGAGTIFGANILGAAYQPFKVFGFPPGAFIALGLMMALYNLLAKKYKLG